MTIQNPHQESGLRKMNDFKEMVRRLDGWKFVSEKDGVKIHTMSDSTGFDIIRGDFILKGTDLTAKEVAIIPNTGGTKVFWDQRNDMAELKNWYNENEVLFWGRVKTPWPIANRDVITAAMRDYVSDDETYTVVYSVDESSVPPTSANVRGHVYHASWRFLKTSEGISITYVTQFDMAGSIPTSFLKTVNLENPLNTAKIAKYAKDFGFPPYTVNYSEDCVQRDEIFNHSKKTFVVKLDGAGSVDVFISKKMYPSGIKVKVSGKASHHINGQKIVITGVNGPTTVEISKA